MARRAKAKQGWLNGTEPVSIKELDAAAETYFDTMQERITLTREEHEAMDSLVEKMIEHDVERYETPDGLIVTVTKKSKCLVKRKKDAEKNGDDHE